MGGGGLAFRGFFGAGDKLEVAGDGDMGIGREERASSKASWESDWSETSVVRRPSESRGGGSITACWVAIQFRPGGRYLNWLKYKAAAYMWEAMGPCNCQKRTALALRRPKFPAS